MQDHNFGHSLERLSSRLFCSHLEIPLSTTNESWSIGGSEETVDELLSPSKDIIMREPLSPNFVDSVNKGFLKNTSQKKSKLKSEVRENVNNGLWTKEEHQRFLIFWEGHEKKPPQVEGLELASKKIRKRRKKKYFDEMAEFIVTRDAKQCRSHEQKFCEYLKKVSKKQARSKPFKTVGNPEVVEVRDSSKMEVGKKSLQSGGAFMIGLDGQSSLSTYNRETAMSNETRGSEISLRGQRYDSLPQLSCEYSERFSQSWNVFVPNLQYSRIGQNSTPTHLLTNFEKDQRPFLNLMPWDFHPGNSRKLVEDLIFNCEQFNLLASQKVLSEDSSTTNWQE